MSYFSLSKLFGFFFIISSLIPWVGIRTLDSQPFSVIFCILFLLLNYQNLSKMLIYYQYLISLFLITIIALLVCFFYYDQPFFSFLTLRGLFNYFGFIILITGYLMYLSIYKFPLKINNYHEIFLGGGNLFSLINIFIISNMLLPS